MHSTLASGSSTASSIAFMSRARSPCSRARSRCCTGSGSRRRWSGGNDTFHLHIHAGERVVAVPLFDVGLEDTAYPFLLFISQAETEAVLNEHLAERGVNVERGVELVDFEAGREDVRCTLRHRGGRTERLHARYLVGCGCATRSG
jgi:FAD binding domain